MARRLGARSGPVVTAQVSRPHLACRIACLFGATRCQAETAVTFVARSLCVAETAVTFVARSLCVGETAITFARSKCVFLRHCGRAKVSLVSCVPVNERAKAVVVSFGREVVRPARSQHPKFGVLCSLGEFFAEEPLEGLCWASFFVRPSGNSWCWANFVSPWHGPSALFPGFYRLWEPQPGPAGFGTASRPVAVGVLQH